VASCHSSSSGQRQAGLASGGGASVSCYCQCGGTEASQRGAALLGITAVAAAAVATAVVAPGARPAPAPVVPQRQLSLGGPPGSSGEAAVAAAAFPLGAQAVVAAPAGAAAGVAWLLFSRLLAHVSRPQQPP
jgi:hypothetical protein